MSIRVTIGFGTVRGKAGRRNATYGAGGSIATEIGAYARSTLLSRSLTGLG